MRGASTWRILAPGGPDGWRGRPPFFPPSDVTRVGLVLFHVAALLPLVVDLILLEVGLVDVLGAHSQRLGERYEEVEQVDHLDPRILLVVLLVFGPPLPRYGIDELGQFLLHRARVVEDPFG